ncbi:4-alpha-glucanotransferase [Candidatus Sumerlaeota bacterium]|nr:4-alpha-glucanotransferase [Candidatus Sumerlaeota bacterium]
MNFPRASGVILHPSSIPGPFGIGELGKEAFDFIDLLDRTAQGLWQLMPLGPTGYGDSPYACLSAFAGNPLLISLEKLKEQGLLSPNDLKNKPEFSFDRVDFGSVIPWKMEILYKAYRNFRSDAQNSQKSAFDQFCMDQAFWLEDFSLFMALKQVHQSAWKDWHPELIRRDPRALYKAASEHADLASAYKFYQYLFQIQWHDVRSYANQKGIRIIGDIPIFVAYDSAEVWAQQNLFHLDETGKPTIVAGVPPDYFSKTGQLWGNPLYRWDVMKDCGFKWWIERFRKNLALFDIIRLDHFRGFEAYWEVPAHHKTAMNGKWVKAPGAELFHTIKGAIGDVAIIAEDLGVITPEVEALRDAFSFPGMKILQFAFGSGSDNPYLPHNYIPNCVVYTGTHDNDTCIGWYRNSSTPGEQDHIRRYTGTNGSEINWDMIRLAFSSVAHSAIVPMQDILGLDGSARMNFPGKPSGNWIWRFEYSQMTNSIETRLRDLTRLFGRAKKQS